LNPRILKQIEKSGLRSLHSWVRYGIILNPNAPAYEKRAAWAAMVQNQALMKAVYCRKVQLALQAASHVPNSFESPEYFASLEVIVKFFPSCY
jgi:hypothetical protein